MMNFLNGGAELTNMENLFSKNNKIVIRIKN